MPLVIDPDASQCDVCLETYKEGEVAPVVLACGHVLCRPCSQSIGASCHLCRGWFNRDRIIKLHVDYGPSNESAAHKAKAIEVRLTQLSGVYDVQKVRTEAKSIIEWLEEQEGSKPPMLRTYCELVLKLCTVTESKGYYKDRAREYESKLISHKDESHAKIHELTTQLDEANRILQSLQPQTAAAATAPSKPYSEPYTPSRPSNPLPAPPEPVDYMFDMSPKFQANLELHPPSGSVSRKSSRNMTKGKETEREIKGKSSSKRLFSRSGTTSSRHKTDNEGGSSYNNTPYTPHRGTELPSTSDTDAHSQHHHRHHRTPSKSHDDLSAHFFPEGKPRSYSHGESRYPPEPPYVEYGAHNDPFLNISSRPRDDQRSSKQSLSSYRYPSSSSSGMPTSSSSATTTFPHRSTSDDMNHYGSHHHPSNARRSSDDTTASSAARRTSSLGHSSSKYYAAPYSAPAESHMPTNTATTHAYGPLISSSSSQSSHSHPQSTRRYSSIPYQQQPSSGYVTAESSSSRSHHHAIPSYPPPPPPKHARRSSSSQSRTNTSVPQRQPSVAHSRTSSQGQVDPTTTPQEQIVLASISNPPVRTRTLSSSQSSQQRPSTSGARGASETIVYPHSSDGYTSQDGHERLLRRSSTRGRPSSSSGAMA